MRTARLVMVLSALVYVVMLCLLGPSGLRHFSSRALVAAGALYAPLVRDGQLHRLLTACFIHVSAFHLVTNMAALEAVGRVLEPHFGRRRFAALYLLSGLGGSGVSFLAHLQHPIASAGASGAICGLLGAAAVASQLKHDHRRRDAMLAWAMAVLVAGTLAGADDAAHAGGLVTGALIAWLLDAGGRAARRTDAREPMGLEAAFLVVTVGAGFALNAYWH